MRIKTSKLRQIIRRVITETVRKEKKVRRSSYGKPQGPRYRYQPVLPETKRAADLLRSVGAPYVHATEYKPGNDAPGSIDSRGGKVYNKTLGFDVENELQEKLITKIKEEGETLHVQVVISSQRFHASVHPNTSRKSSENVKVFSSYEDLEDFLLTGEWLDFARSKKQTGMIEL